jgi:hypothetical protein
MFLLHGILVNLEGSMRPRLAAATKMAITSFVQKMQRAARDDLAWWAKTVVSAAVRGEHFCDNCNRLKFWRRFPNEEYKVALQQFLGSEFYVELVHSSENGSFIKVSWR